MKSEEEKVDTQLIKTVRSWSPRNVEVLLSIIDDEMHSHMGLRTFEVAPNEQLLNSHRSMACKEKSWVTADMFRIAARKSPEQIDRLIISSILGREDLHSSLLDRMACCRETSAVDSNSDSESADEVWGLESRKPRQKLSQYQIKFLELEATDSGLTIRQLSENNRVSVSTFTAIKNKSDREVEKGPVNNIIKIHGKEKV